MLESHISEILLKEKQVYTECAKNSIPFEPNLILLFFIVAMVGGIWLTHCDISKEWTLKSYGRILFSKVVEIFKTTLGIVLFLAVISSVFYFLATFGVIVLIFFFGG